MPRLRRLIRDPQLLPRWRPTGPLSRSGVNREIFAAAAPRFLSSRCSVAMIASPSASLVEQFDLVEGQQPGPVLEAMAIGPEQLPLSTPPDRPPHQAAGISTRCTSSPGIRARCGARKIVARRPAPASTGDQAGDVGENTGAISTWPAHDRPRLGNQGGEGVVGNFRFPAAESRLIKVPFCGLRAGRMMPHSAKAA